MEEAKLGTGKGRNRFDFDYSPKLGNLLEQCTITYFRRCLTIRDKPGKLVTTVVIYYSYASYIGNTDSDTDFQCFELVILRQGDCTETRPSHATLNLLNRRHPVSRRLRATDHWVNQQPGVHKPSVSTEACKLFNIFHKLAPGEDRTRVSPRSDACPYHPDRGGLGSFENSYIPENPRTPSISYISQTVIPFKKTDFGTLQNVHNHYNSLNKKFEKTIFLFLYIIGYQMDMKLLGCVDQYWNGMDVHQLQHCHTLKMSKTTSGLICLGYAASYVQMSGFQKAFGIKVARKG
ncbi:hypothetical protein LXL04_012661 [Taraxacum kok-saghyz]